MTLDKPGNPPYKLREAGSPPTIAVPRKEEEGTTQETATRKSRRERSRAPVRGAGTSLPPDRGETVFERVAGNPTVVDVQRFASADRRYARLPEDLRRVAVEQATRFLETPAEDLPFLAVGLDNLALDDAFVRYDHTVEGPLLLNWELARRRLYQRGHSDEEVQRIAVEKLRRALTRREVRHELASVLGYQPGDEERIVQSPDFKAATALATNAVKAFSPD